jgi:hypothetical protein
MPRCLRFVFLTLGLLVCAHLGAQDVLNNEAVIKLVKAGLAEDLIISTIKTQPGKYSMGADHLIALKEAGVSDKIIQIMMAKPSNTATANPAAAPGPAPADSPAAHPVMEIGVYFKKGDQWADLPPEIVNWKTGGVLKTIGTSGLLKPDMNGNLPGGHSPNQLKTPIEILIYTPEGTAITEYQFLHLREHKDSREFRTVTGGFLHTSGGANRDMVPFESKKIAPRTFTISLPGIKGGEYGFLPPGAAVSSHASSSLGKMYTFRVLE